MKMRTCEGVMDWIHLSSLRKDFNPSGLLHQQDSNMKLHFESSNLINKTVLRQEPETFHETFKDGLEQGKNLPSNCSFKC